jgi:hypothetical protein
MVTMKHALWHLLLVVMVVALAGCAGSGGSVAAETKPEAPAAPAPAAPPVEQAAPAATPAATPAPEEPLFNRLKWSTASEVDNFGFDIYRSTAEDGPFERLTSQPIPGAGTVDEPRYYEYKDTAIDPTVDYFYYVESISVDGIREKFSPTIRAPAKRPKVAEGASESAP